MSHGDKFVTRLITLSLITSVMKTDSMDGGVTRQFNHVSVIFHIFHSMHYIKLL